MLDKEIIWLLKEKYHNKPGSKFNKDVQRLKAGEPVDYVIGFTEFLGCKIDLGNKPLIPRPETEFWVGETLKEINKGRVLDIFSGSGCIGIAILKNNKKVLCDFSDRDKNAIKQIKVNLKINNINLKRYKIIQSDIFENINNKYDYIFANPPYIPTTRKSKIQKSVFKFEPKTALFGGKDGLFYIKKFLVEARNHLNDDGKIFMEFDYIQKRELERMIRKYNYKNYKFHKDQYNKWRWVKING